MVVIRRMKNFMNVPDVPQDSNVTVEEAASFDTYVSILTETEMRHVDAVKKHSFN